MRLFLVFLLSFFTILFTNVNANIEVTFMKKILNKCTRKLQSFEQSDVSFSSKLLAKAVPPSKLKSKYITKNICYNYYGFLKQEVIFPILGVS